MSRLNPVLGRQSHSVLSCRAPLCQSSATRSRQPSCRAGGRDVGGSKRAFYLAERIPAVNEGTISAASDIRTPTEIRPVRTEGRLRLSVVLSGLAKSRVQAVLFYLEVERALRNPELFGHHRQVAVASRDRSADGVALDGVKIRNRRGLR